MRQVTNINMNVIARSVRQSNLENERRLLAGSLSMGYNKTVTCPLLESAVTGQSLVVAIGYIVPSNVISIKVRR